MIRLGVGRAVDDLGRGVAGVRLRPAAYAGRHRRQEVTIVLSALATRVVAAGRVFSTREMRMRKMVLDLFPSPDLATLGYGALAGGTVGVVLQELGAGYWALLAVLGPLIAALVVYWPHLCKVVRSSHIMLPTMDSSRVTFLVDSRYRPDAVYQSPDPTMRFSGNSDCLAAPVGRFFIVGMFPHTKNLVDSIIAGPYASAEKAAQMKRFYDRHPWTYWFTMKNRLIWAWAAAAIAFLASHAFDLFLHMRF